VLCEGLNKILYPMNKQFLIIQAVSFQASNHRIPKLVFESSVLNQAEWKKAIIFQTDFHNNGVMTLLTFP